MTISRDLFELPSLRPLCSDTPRVHHQQSVAGDPTVRATWRRATAGRCPGRPPLTVHSVAPAEFWKNASRPKSSWNGLRRGALNTVKDPSMPPQRPAMQTCVSRALRLTHGVDGVIVRALPHGMSIASLATRRRATTPTLMCGRPLRNTHCVDVGATAQTKAASNTAILPNRASRETEIRLPAQSGVHPGDSCEDVRALPIENF